MKQHFRSFWFLYLFGAFVIAYYSLAVVVEVGHDKEEKRCLKAGYHYVEENCYKTIVPAEWEK